MVTIPRAKAAGQRASATLGTREFPPFRLDTVNECLWRRAEAGDQRIPLTPKAFAVLRYLAERAGTLVTQDELLNAVWANMCVQPEVLKSQILDIRRCLGDHPRDPQFIETLPRRGYRFIGSLAENPRAGSKLNIEHALPKLVGRDGALLRLGESLERALRCEAQIVFVSGDAGIGKTALVDQFQHWLAAEGSSIRLGRGQCIEGYAGTEAYYPMLEALGQLCAEPDGSSVVQILCVRAPTWLVQFPALLKHEQREMLQGEIRGATRERMLREISDALTAIASDRPLLLIFEDLHRADPSTVDLISALARRRQSARLMLVGTYQPAEAAIANHPLRALVRELTLHRLCQEIALAPLDEANIADYLAETFGDSMLPDGFAGLIYRYTAGNPMFLMTILDDLRERKLIKQIGPEALAAPPQTIEFRAPESLRQMIELRIGRLSEQERRILEAASAVGDTFSTLVCAEAANIGPETCETLFDTLSRRHQMVRPAGSAEFPDGTVSECFEFMHAMYREVLYQRQATGRRAKLHRSIGELMAALYALDNDDIVPELAHHFERSGDWSRAIQYLMRAADVAGRRFGPRQAAKTLEHALELVNNLPHASRAVQEMLILERSATICDSCGPQAFSTRKSLPPSAVRSPTALNYRLEIAKL